MQKYITKINTSTYKGFLHSSGNSMNLIYGFTYPEQRSARWWRRHDDNALNNGTSRRLVSYDVVILSRPKLRNVKIVRSPALLFIGFWRPCWPSG